MKNSHNTLGSQAPKVLLQLFCFERIPNTENNYVVSIRVSERQFSSVLVSISRQTLLQNMALSDLKNSSCPTSLLSHFYLPYIICCSTAGYGILVPTTQLGRILCVLYAFFGIPMNIVFLSYVGQFLTFLIDCLFSLVVCFIPCLGEERFTSERSESTNHNQPVENCNGSGSVAGRDPPTIHWVHPKVVPSNTNGVLSGTELVVVHHAYSLCMEVNARNAFDEGNDLGEDSGHSCGDHVSSHASASDRSAQLDAPSIKDQLESNCTDNEDTLKTSEKQEMNLNGHGCSQCTQEQQRVVQNLRFCEHRLKKSRQKAPLSFVMLCIIVSVSVSSALIHFFGKAHISFIDAVYMQFVTITTIGFGDMVPTPKNVPGNTNAVAWMLIDMINILFGLAALSTILSSLTQTDRVAKTRRWMCEKIHNFNECCTA